MELENKKMDFSFVSEHWEKPSYCLLNDHCGILVIINSYNLLLLLERYLKATIRAAEGLFGYFILLYTCY